jgi:hypothetical protein
LPFIWKNVPWRVVLPTFSMSLVRMHFWTLATRRHGGSAVPRMYGMNGTMPAMVNRIEGSGEINGTDGTMAWPLDWK